MVIQIKKLLLVLTLAVRTRYIILKLVHSPVAASEPRTKALVACILGVVNVDFLASVHAVHSSSTVLADNKIKRMTTAASLLDSIVLGE